MASINLKSILSGSLAACLFLIVVGTKWATLDRFGSPMPDWDQWDAEAVELFIPWFENDHFITHLFNPHNEHRVVLTKLQSLALGLLNGQWDSRLEAAVNALLHAALAVGFWLVGRRWLAAHWHAALFGLIAILISLPLAWQNVLGGFHSQQYWMLGLSFTAIVLLPFARAWSLRWWLGLATATCVLGSMGSGFLAAAVIFTLVIWRIIAREISWRAASPTLVSMGLLIAIGLLTRHEVAWHQKLKAATVHDFCFSIIRSLQWPLRDSDWAAPILWLPWTVTLWKILSRRSPKPALAAADFSQLRDPATGIFHDSSLRAGQTIAALGGWVLIQIIATAYARGAGADYPASRYMDTLAFGALVNAVAIGWLLTPTTRTADAPTASESSPPAAAANHSVLIPTTSTARRSGTHPWTRRALHAFGLAWLLTFSFGLHHATKNVLRYELVDARKYYIKAEANMRRYLGTNDPQHLAHPEIPFPSAQGLIDRLARPSLRALMPLPIRAPLPLTPANAPLGFAANDARGANLARPPRLGLSPATPPLDAAPSWGSFHVTDGTAATSEWQSAPVPPTAAPWLKFETAGHAGENGVSLELRSVRTGHLLGTVSPSKVPGDTWRAAYVRTPAEPYFVLAKDTDPTRWLAFSGPTEMGGLSYWAAQATKHGLLILALATAATLTGALVSWLSTERRT